MESDLCYTITYGGVNMKENQLKHRLLSDLTQLNLAVEEVDIHIRPYSKTYYGRYFPVYNDKKVIPRIFVYPYDCNNEFMDYEIILETVIHEFCHHIQYTSGSFVRNKGVMHDTQFWKLYNHYMNRAKKYKIIKGESDEKVS